MTVLCLDGGGLSSSLLNCCGAVERQCGMSSGATLIILHVISFPISLPKHYVQIILYKNLKNVLKKTT